MEDDIARLLIQRNELILPPSMILILLLELIELWHLSDPSVVLHDEHFLLQTNENGSSIEIREIGHILPIGLSQQHEIIFQHRHPLQSHLL